MKKNNKRHLKKAKKIDVSWFYTDARFFDSIDALLMPQVFASGGSSCCSGCFLPDTPILMADYSSKKIKDVKKGDAVCSYNFSKEILREGIVEKVLKHPKRKGAFVLNGSLNVTGNHQIWVVNKKAWTKVHIIQVGDIILNQKGEEIGITSIDKLDGIYDIYNLHIKGKHHNYFAGGFLVHNKTAP